MRNAYTIVVGKPEGKRPLGRSKRTGEDDIKMDHQDCGLDSPGSGYGPLAGCCEHRNKPSSFITGGEFID
jgi:hypothetical protein